MFSNSKKIKYFENLTLNKTSNITNKLKQTTINLLKKKLKKKLKQNKTPLTKIILQNKKYHIHTYTNLIKNNKKTNKIKLFKKITLITKLTSHYYKSNSPFTHNNLTNYK